MSDELYKDDNRLSECCYVPMWHDYDICPRCKEHSTPVETDEE